MADEIENDIDCFWDPSLPKCLVIIDTREEAQTEAEANVPDAPEPVPTTWDFMERGPMVYSAQTYLQIGSFTYLGIAFALFLFNSLELLRWRADRPGNSYYKEWIAIGSQIGDRNFWKTLNMIENLSQIVLFGYAFINQFMTIAFGTRMDQNLAWWSWIPTIMAIVYFIELNVLITANGLANSVKTDITLSESIHQQASHLQWTILGDVSSAMLLKAVFILPLQYTREWWVEDQKTRIAIRMNKQYVQALDDVRAEREDEFNPEAESTESASSLLATQWGFSF